MILLVAALAAAAAPPAPPSRGIVTIIRARVVRVLRGGPPPPPVAVRERKGPRCIPAGAIAGAAVTALDDVDLVLKGGDHVRAKLDDDCPALDFYRGFYVSPSADGRICAGRDAIRTRAGGECAIERFRKLVPAAP